MAQPELPDLPQRARQALEVAGAFQPPHGLELDVRGAAGADEIRVIGIGKPVCARPRLRDDARLVKGERRGSGTREGEQVGDRLGAFRIREGMAWTLVNSQRDVFARRQLDEEVGALAVRRPDLEMRRTRPRNRAGTEESSSQIRGPAARPRKHAPGRPVRRSEPAGQHARLVKQLKRPPVARDVQLVARPLFERAPSVRPDLGGDVEVTKERERTAHGGGAREIEMDGHFPPAAEVETPRHVKQRR